MKTEDYEILLKAAKILRREYKKWPVCKEYGFQCLSCNVHIAVTNLCSLIEFYIDDPRKKLTSKKKK